MKYQKLKQELLDKIEDLHYEDFYLLEGKLIFKSNQKALMVKSYLEEFNEVMMRPAPNHAHWKNNYSTCVYFKNLDKEV